MLAGLCHESGDPPARALFARLHATGKIDTSFANDGYLLIQPQGADLNFLLERLVVQTNKRLLGIGYTSDEDDYGLLISREADGRENIQFNRGKPLLEKLDDLATSWHEALIQKDGSILVYGHLYDPARVVVAKFTDAAPWIKPSAASAGCNSPSAPPARPLPGSLMTGWCFSG